MVHNFIALGECLCVYVGLIMFSMRVGCSKNPVNQATAKATLIYSSIFEVWLT